MSAVEGQDPRALDAGRFDPEVLDRSVLAIPLLHQLEEEEKALRAGRRTEPRAHSVVVEINLDHTDERPETYEEAEKLITDAIKQHPGVADQRLVDERSASSKQYLFARLGGDAIRQVVDRNERDDPSQRAIFRIWPDFPIGRL